MEKLPLENTATDVELIKTICAEGMIEIGGILMLSGNPYSNMYIPSRNRPSINGLAAHLELARLGFIERVKKLPTGLAQSVVEEEMISQELESEFINTPIGTIIFEPKTELPGIEGLHFDSFETTIACLNRIRQISLAGFGLSGFGEIDFATTYWGINNTTPEGLWTQITVALDVLYKIQNGTTLSVQKYTQLLKLMHLCAGEIHYLKNL